MPTLSTSLSEYERRLVLDALTASGGSLARAAAALGVDHARLWRLVVRHGLAAWALSRRESGAR